MGSNLKVGDAVILKSAELQGGSDPFAMVIVAIENGKVECEWHSTGGAAQSRKYPAEVLKRVSSIC